MSHYLALAGLELRKIHVSPYPVYFKCFYLLVFSMEEFRIFRVIRKINKNLKNSKFLFYYIIMNEYEGSILWLAACHFTVRPKTKMITLKTSESPSHIPGVEHTGSESVAAEV